MEVPDTMWIERVLLWVTVGMPTGSGKTPLFTFLTAILGNVRKTLKVSSASPSWLLDEASFEKMGDIMSKNKGRILGLYDELLHSLFK